MNEDSGVYVIGAGGHAKVVVSTLLAIGHKIHSIFDDNDEKWGAQLLGVPVTGPISEFKGFLPARAVMAVGDNASRKALSEKLVGADWITVVHPHAYVHPSVNLGSGTVVFAGAIMQPDNVVGAHCIVNTGATVDHDCVIGDYVHIAPGVNLGGEVKLQEGVFLGIGSSVIPRVGIGSWTIVGAGGVVVRDLSSKIVAAGIPAKPLKES